MKSHLGSRSQLRDYFDKISLGYFWEDCISFFIAFLSYTAVFNSPPFIPFPFYPLLWLPCSQGGFSWWLIDTRRGSPLSWVLVLDYIRCKAKYERVRQSISSVSVISASMFLFTFLLWLPRVSFPSLSDLWSVFIPAKKWDETLHQNIEMLLWQTPMILCLLCLRQLCWRVVKILGTWVLKFYLNKLTNTTPAWFLFWISA